MLNDKFNRRKRGYVLLMTTISMAALLPVIGLAVDVTLLYLIKARLSAAVDSGALAAARSLSRGLDLTSQASSAQATALQYFRANFPAGYMLTPDDGADPTINVDATSDNIRRVTIDATVAAPLYFLRMLNATSVDVRAVGQASRRDVNVIVVLDRSGSLQDSGFCDDMQAASTNFVNKFAEGRDRVGMVSFARSSTINFPADYDFKTDSPNIETMIANINCAGWTAGPAGLSMGYEEIARLNEPGSLNVILFFTDGIPNVLSMDWPIKRQPPETDPANASTCALGTAPTCPAGFDCIRGTLTLQAVDQTGGSKGMYPITGIINPPSDPSNTTYAAGTGTCKFVTAANPNIIDNTTGGDVAFMPPTDVWGNSVNGYHGAPDSYTSGNYVGRYRVNWGSSFERSAQNALYNAAVRIRADATLAPVIYVIGLGDLGPVQHELLENVANDPAGGYYDTSKKTGLYVFAPDGAALDNAFQRIASEILRLSL